MDKDTVFDPLILDAGVGKKGESQGKTQSCLFFSSFLPTFGIPTEDTKVLQRNRKKNEKIG